MLAVVVVVVNYYCRLSIISSSSAWTYTCVKHAHAHAQSCVNVDITSMQFHIHCSIISAQPFSGSEANMMSLFDKNRQALAQLQSRLVHTTDADIRYDHQGLPWLLICPLCISICVNCWFFIPHSCIHAGKRPRGCCSCSSFNSSMLSILATSELIARQNYRRGTKTQGYQGCL